MANEKDPLEAFTAMAAQTADYFGWLLKPAVSRFYEPDLTDNPDSSVVLVKRLSLSQ